MPSVATESQAAVDHGTWSGACQFFVASLGSAVGLGNVWRFPNVVYTNGGAAFLIVYILCLIIIGIPVVLLESAVGQYSKKGPIGVWDMAPLLRGVGFATMFSSFCIRVYYNTPISWAAYYFVNSFTTELPWKAAENESEFESVAAETYFFNHTLKMSSGVDEWGGFSWELYLCNAVIWLLIYLGVFLGPKSLGKITYFTSLFPYVMLTVLLVYTATLPGAERGIQFYIAEVDWTSLGKVSMWREAVAQVLFSTSCASGVVLNLASYNQFHHNIYRDAIIIPIADGLTSIFAGFSVFTVLGYIAEKTNATSVADVVESGPGLIFVSYPEAFAAIDYGYIWSALFFFMVILLGLSSQLPGVDMNCGVYSDLFPVFNRTRVINLIFRFCFVLLLFGATTFFFFGFGYYWYYVVDARISGMPLIIISIFELIGIGLVYNRPFLRNNLVKNIEAMVGDNWSNISWTVWRFIKYLWIVSWGFIAPAMLLFVFIYDLASIAPLKVNDYIFPEWAVDVSWGIIAVSPTLIFIGAVVVPCWRYGGFSAWLEAAQPNESWEHPSDNANEPEITTDIPLTTIATAPPVGLPEPPEYTADPVPPDYAKVNREPVLTTGF